MYQLNGKIAGLTAYEPVDNRGCVRLDANESFLGLPEELKAGLGQALGSLELNRYPDPAAKELCGAFAEYYGVEPGHVTAGNGSDELISVIFQAFLEKGEAFATLEPDFSMYAQGGLLAEARHVSIPKPGFAVDVEDTIARCKREGVRLLIFSNPCNPTSLVLKREQVRQLVRSLDNTLVVLDEAYMDFSGESLLGEEGEFDNLILLRTCSKALGLAALRLGFAVANQTLTGKLRAAKAPYNVNSLSQAVGADILSRTQMLREALDTILASRGELLAGLEDLGKEFPGRFRILPGETNFAALVMESGPKAQQRLLEKGVAVRFTGGLLRVTCGREEENRAFLGKFREVLEELA